jgi:MSHA biogenesis protein MshJ
MEALKGKFEVLADRIDAMSVRERGLIFFAVVVVLAMFAYNVVFGPMRAEQQRLERDLKSKQEQIRTADLQVTTMLAGGKDINAENRAKVEALTRQIQEVDARMDQLTAGVVTPKEMARLMEQVLSRSRALELVKLEALPAMPIDAEPTPAGSAPTRDAMVVYRHGMRVELKGRYFDIVQYLKALEGLQWKVFWGEISLETDKHPVSKVTLVIYTLSRHSGWIGV